MVCSAPPLLCSDIDGSITGKLQWIREMVDGSFQEISEKIESNPRLLTCGFGVIFGRIEYVFKKRERLIPVKDVRAILLAPVLKFQKEFPGYSEFLARQLINGQYRGLKSQSLSDCMKRGVKKLESDYGNFLRSVVNKP